MTELPSTVLVYGTGTFGRSLAESLTRCGVEVAGFIDRRPPAGELTAPFIGLDREAVPGADVVLGVCNPAASPRLLRRMLLDRGVNSVLSPVEAAIAIHRRRGEVVENYWLTGDTTRIDFASNEIALARSRLADGESQRIFDSILEYRRTGRFDALDGCEPTPDQYFPVGLGFETSRMRYLDVGAYDGDTVRDLSERRCDVEAVLAIEPDPASWELLEAELAALAIGEARGLNVAVGRLPGSLAFDARGASSSRFDSAGSRIVDVGTLDAVAFGFRPTHLKMDIEGAEQDALAGAGALLAAWRPRIAVSAYHRPEDLWSILLQIDEMELGYRFWLRVHGEQTFDTVLYCLAGTGDERLPEDE